MNRIMQMMQRGPDEKDFKILESCLSEEELASFLELLENPMEIPGMPATGNENPMMLAGMPTFGTQIGLINFIVERHKSVTEQLQGIRDSSSGDGSGNGGSFGMMGNFRPPGGGG